MTLNSSCIFVCFPEPLNSALKVCDLGLFDEHYMIMMIIVIIIIQLKLYSEIKAKHKNKSKLTFELFTQ